MTNRLFSPTPVFLWPGLAFDGGLTNDQPCLSAHTVTVSCLNRDADVNAQRHRESVGAAPLFALHEMVRTPPFERVWEIAGGAEVLYQPSMAIILSNRSTPAMIRHFLRFLKEKYVESVVVSRPTLFSCLLLDSIWVIGLAGGRGAVRSFSRTPRVARCRRALFAAGVALVSVIGLSSSAIISIVAVGIIGAVSARAARVKYHDQRIIFMASPSVFWNCEWHVMCLYC